MGKSTQHGCFVITESRLAGMTEDTGMDREQEANAWTQSAHSCRHVAATLPPRGEWPDFLFGLPGARNPED